MPNQTNNPNGNFATAYSTGGDVDQYTERIDYSLSSKQRIYGRYTHNHILSLPDAPFSQICTDRCTEDTRAHQVSLGDTYAFSPKTILDVHIGYTRYVYLRTPLSQGIEDRKSTRLNSSHPSISYAVFCLKKKKKKKIKYCQ